MLTAFSAPDPFLLTEPTSIDGGKPWYEASGKVFRTTDINPAVKTLVLILAGQSNCTNISPSVYSTSYASEVDNFSIGDGANYEAAGALLGCSYAPPVFGPGHVGVRVADLLISNGKFGRIILVPIAIGGTKIERWAEGDCSRRFEVAMLRLAARGIVPGMTGVTFGAVMLQGESDKLAGTSEASYAASGQAFIGKAFSTGFNGRLFYCNVSYAGGTSSAVRAAQASLWNGATVFSGGDLDSLTGANRQADATHFSDAGSAAAATLVYNAMSATGAPY